MKEDGSIWLGPIWGPQTAALGTLPSAKHVYLRYDLRYRSEGWGWGLNSQASCIASLLRLKAEEHKQTAWQQ